MGELRKAVQRLVSGFDQVNAWGILNRKRGFWNAAKVCSRAQRDLAVPPRLPPADILLLCLRHPAEKPEDNILPSAPRPGRGRGISSHHDGGLAPFLIPPQPVDAFHHKHVLRAPRPHWPLIAGRLKSFPDSFSTMMFPSATPRHPHGGKLAGFVLLAGRHPHISAAIYRSPFLQNMGDILRKRTAQTYRQRCFVFK